MKKSWKPALSLTLTALWLCFIYARSAQNAAVSHEESVSVLTLLLRLAPSLTLHTVRKLAHFTEFFILGGLLWLDWRLLERGKVLLPLGAGLLFAAGDELLQCFVPGRSGELADVLLDFCGVAAAVGLGCLLRRGREIRAHDR